MTPADRKRWIDELARVARSERVATSCLTAHLEESIQVLKNGGQSPDIGRVVAELEACNMHARLSPLEGLLFCQIRLFLAECKAVRRQEVHVARLVDVGSERQIFVICDESRLEFECLSNASRGELCFRARYRAVEFWDLYGACVVGSVVGFAADIPVKARESVGGERDFGVPIIAKIGDNLEDSAPSKVTFAFLPQCCQDYLAQESHSNWIKRERFDAWISHVKHIQNPGRFKCHVCDRDERTGGKSFDLVGLRSHFHSKVHKLVELEGTAAGRLATVSGVDASALVGRSKQPQSGEVEVIADCPSPSRNPVDGHSSTQTDATTPGAIKQRDMRRGQYNTEDVSLRGRQSTTSPALVPGRFDANGPLVQSPTASSPPQARAQSPTKLEAAKVEADFFAILSALEKECAILASNPPHRSKRLLEICELFEWYRKGLDAMMSKFADDSPERVRPQLFRIAKPFKDALFLLREVAPTAQQREQARLVLAVYRLIRHKFVTDRLVEDLDARIDYLEHLRRGDVRTHCWRCRVEFWRGDRPECYRCGGNICETSRCHSCHRNCPRND